MAGRVACWLVLALLSGLWLRQGRQGVDLVRLLVATARLVWRSSAHGGKPSTGR